MLKAAENRLSKEAVMVTTDMSGEGVGDLKSCVTVCEPLVGSWGGLESHSPKKWVRSWALLSCSGSRFPHSSTTARHTGAPAPQ